jgi:hypothetical protein
MPSARARTGCCTTALGAALAAFAPAAARATNVLYYGGPITSDSEIVMVNWGPNVPTTVTAGLPPFYADIVQSNYWTVLLQYSSAGATVQGGLPGTNQQLGMGSFAGAFTIMPAVCPTGATCTVDSAQIQAELVGQIDAHNLPAPSLDAQGYPNTLYVVHFPPAVTIKSGNNSSCVQFCAISTNFDYGA